MAEGTLPNSNGGTWLIILLLLLLGVGVLFSLGSLNLTGSQTNTGGQCPFYAQQEPYNLAQQTEQQRIATPFGGNYGMGSYTICFKDGSSYYYSTPVYQGYHASLKSGLPKNKSHSEQFVDDNLYEVLSDASFDRSQLEGIYVIIFSEVIVCPPCQQDMQYWQRDLRDAAKTQLLFLSIWQLKYGSGFNPAKFPSGTGTPVTMDALVKVRINFLLFIKNGEQAECMKRFLMLS